LNYFILLPGQDPFTVVILPVLLLVRTCGRTDLVENLGVLSTRIVIPPSNNFVISP